MQHLTITPNDTDQDTPSAHPQRKSRSFTVCQVCRITADDLWPGGAADTPTLRPIWLQLLGSNAAMQSFVANLRQGRPAQVGAGRHPPRIELLRSAGYAYHWQRGARGVVVTAYLPGLVALDPGMIDAQRCAFVCLTPRWWVARHGPQAEAVRFAAFVRQRTRRPLFTDAAFSGFLLEQALQRHLAQRPAPHSPTVTAVGLDDAGLLPPVQVNVAQTDLDTFLSHTVHAWVAQEERIAA